jgi:hypothetical protein
MTKLLVGFVLGLVVATVGFAGVAKILDRGIDTVKIKSKEMAQ